MSKEKQQKTPSGQNEARRYPPEPRQKEVRSIRIEISEEEKERIKRDVEAGLIPF